MIYTLYPLRLGSVDKEKEVIYKINVVRIECDRHQWPDLGC